MEILTNLLFLALIFFLSIKAIRSFVFPRSKKLNIPPGPKPLPIIGNLLELGGKPHKSLAKLSESYGPIMCLKLGQVTTIIVTSPSIAKDIIQKNSQFFSNRKVPDATSASEHQHFSLAWLPVSNLWRNLRKIISTHLLAARVLDANMNLRHNKVEEFLRDVRKSSEAGESVEIGKAAFMTSLNLLSSTFFSMDLADSNSDTGEEIKGAVRGMIEEMGRPNIADSFPFLKMIDPQGIRKRNNIYFRKMLDLFDTIINQRSKLGAKSASGKDTDILDILIDLTENAEDKRVHEQLQKSTIGHLLLDIFGAGTETTSATLEWSMAELLKAPEAMSKAKAELEQVIGKGKKMKESDIPQLPYLQAIIKETLRLHPPAPLLVPRLAESDVEVCGYTIPKDAQVLINVWAIGRDPNVWENPDKFMPERFLKSNIDAGGRDFELIPFGAGRRICPGMLLANRILHLTLGSLLNSFDWKLEDGVEPDTLNMEDKYGLTLIMDQPLRAIPTVTST